MTLPEPERFAIAANLLAGDGSAAGWSNLGLWHQANDYADACRALARRHGEAILLRPGDRVLELGCGTGAGLDLWRQEFAVADAVGVECRAEAVLSRHDIVTGWFDRPLPDSLSGRQFDAIVCVDAAYHAASLPALLATLSPALAPAGRVAISLLIQPPDYRRRSVWRRYLHERLLRAALISPSLFCDEAMLRQQLERAGLRNVQCQDLSADVLAGFAGWVGRRHQSLSSRQRCTRDWWKIRLTAVWCGWLHRYDLGRYVLVTAQRE